jgi:hypothetical protein
MTDSVFAPLLNSSLPREFRYIRLERARDHDHPEGDGRIAYIMLAPLDTESRIDAALWQTHKDACRVVRKRPDGEDRIGHLVRGPGGNWRFHYDVSNSAGDETGYHFGDEPFTPGEYVSIRDVNGTSPYRVVAVSPL